MNLAGLLEQSAVSYGDRPAVSVGDRRIYSYAEYGALAARLAGALTERFKLAPGDRVAVLMTNNPDYLAVLFAAWQAGLVAVPANAKLHPRELAHVVADSGARLVIATADVAGALAPVLPPGVVLLVHGDGDWRGLLQGEPAGIVARRPDDPAWIFYTSGTTGRPKGATLTHRNLLAMTVSYLADVDRLTEEDVLFHLTAQSHAGGLFGLSYVAKASHHVMPPSGGFDPHEVAALIGLHRNVTLFVPPTGLRRLVDEPAIAAAPVDHVRTVLLGAAPVYIADLKRAWRVFGPRLWNGYGQGESPCTITAMSKELLAAALEADDEKRLGSVGIPRTGIEVRALDADGLPVRAGEIGEVCVRGETVMAGYWNLPDASAETLRGGWLHTGDMGAFDERGFLTLLDRAKDLIISGGINIYPREVEEVLLEDPAIAEVAVIGVPDPEWGESVLALMVAAPGAAPDLAALERRCLERIARFKRPRYWRVVESLPKNSAGKVLKRQLREDYSREFSGA
jgi:long-chain acyl-CoA synthetase